MPPTRIRKLTFSAMYPAIAMALPFLTGQIPEIGSMLCPMHIPTLLCGFVCGWPWGLAVDFILPPLRCVLFVGMPQSLSAAGMAFSLQDQHRASRWEKYLSRFTLLFNAGTFLLGFCLDVRLYS